MKYSLLSFLFCFISLVSAGQKKSFSVQDFDHWRYLRNEQISTDGKVISYETAPLRGDSKLFIEFLESEKSKVLDRASKSKMSPSGLFTAFTIKTSYDSIRQLELKKVSKKKWPKDTLGIYLFEQDSLIKIPKFKSFKLPEKNGSWIAISVEKEKKKKKKLSKKEKRKLRKKKKQAKGKKEKKKSKKYKTGDLLLLHPLSGKKHRFKHVKEYVFSRNGNSFSYTAHYGDTIEQTAVIWFDIKTEKADTIYSSLGLANKITFDRSGHQLAFLQSPDTAKAKRYSLMYSKGFEATKVLIDSTHSNFEAHYHISNFRKPFFSRNGKKLFFGLASRVEKEPKDTIPTSEKARLDVWNWKDKQLQSTQLKRKKSALQKSFLAVYHFTTEDAFQLGDSTVTRVVPQLDGNSTFALGYASESYEKSYSWTYPWPRDVYLINLNSGKRELVFKKTGYPISVSNDGKFIIYYNPTLKDWISVNTVTQDTNNLTLSLRNNGQIFFNERSEVPTAPFPVGGIYWTQNNNSILINSSKDIWIIDPTGKKAPQSLTKGFADKHNTKVEYVNLSPDNFYVRLDSSMILHLFNHTTNEEGYYAYYPNMERFSPLQYGAEYISRLKKAEKANRFIFRKETYRDEASIYYTVNNNQSLEGTFSKSLKISTTNQVKPDYKWGIVQQYFWKDFQGKAQKGLLFKPDHMEEGKKYPVIIYFYEKLFHTQHLHRNIRPSRSTISIPFYNSNDYVVFVPDIHYTTGQPGKDAYNAIVSGAKSLGNLNFIDTARIGLQGQSWGGYQTAFLVTRTNMFKAAMAGAPVSNMTSAYGGIRWGSGLSRMFQYEQTQSRLGTTLWEDPKRYIENSPLFYVPNVQTPLLIMHNDKDGAVPWYQGIEMFVAMRRLNKPCWMLTYNGDDHNLRKLPNRIDLSKRMFQFFNHYLKGDPMPDWMKHGVPAVKKGKEYGFKFSE